MARNPYSSEYSRFDENEMRREALLAALDEPTPPRMRDRTRPLPPGPVELPTDRVDVARPYEPPPPTTPEPWRTPASRTDPRRQLEPATSTNPYSTTTITDIAPAPESRDRERAPSGTQPFDYTRDPLTSRPYDDGLTREPSGRQPYDYEPRPDIADPYRVDVDPRRDGEGLAETTNPRQPQPSTSGPRPPVTTPSGDASGAVSRYSFTPQQRTGGAPGESYFESLIGTEVDAQRPVTQYEGGKRPPRAEHLTLEMRSRIEQNFGLDLDHLGQEDIDRLLAAGWRYGDPPPPELEYSDEGLLHRSPDSAKTVARIGAISAAVLATIATGGGASPWLVALIGAGGGAANAVANDGDFSDVLKSAALGGATAGVGAGGGILPRAGVGALGPALTGGDVSDALVGAGLSGVTAAVDPNVGIPTQTNVTDAVITAGLEGATAFGGPSGGPIDPSSLDPLLDGTGAPPRHPPTAPRPSQPPVSGAPPRHGTTAPSPEDEQQQSAMVQEWIADNEAREAQGLPPRTLEEYLALPRAAEAPAPDSMTSGPGGGLPFEGFDFAQNAANRDRTKSAKYSFAAAAQEAAPLTDTSKAGFEQWLRTEIAPRMEQDGHRIVGFEGERINVESASGSGWVDIGRGAGGDDPAFAWQPDDVGGGGGADGPSGATTIEDAYAWLKANADPRMSRAEMEQLATLAFQNVEGFEKAYAGDVVIGGKKLDLITDFGGANPQWSDNLSFQPLHPAGANASLLPGGGTGGLSLASLTPGVSLHPVLGQSDVHKRIQEEIARLISGAPPRDALLAELER